MPGRAEPCGAEAVGEHGYCELHKPLPQPSDGLIDALERGIAAVPGLMRRNPDNGYDQTSAAMRRLIDALKGGDVQPKACAGYDGQGDWSLAIDICRAHGIDPWAEWPAPMTPERFSAAALEVGTAAFNHARGLPQTKRPMLSDWQDAATLVLAPPPGCEVPKGADPEIHRVYRDRGVDFALVRYEAISRGYDVLDPLPEKSTAFEAMRSAVMP